MKQLNYRKYLKMKWNKEKKQIKTEAKPKEDVAIKVEKEKSKSF
jgi:hypothetical protein